MKLFYERNLLQTLQHLIQDVIAPDVREVKGACRFAGNQVDVRSDALDQKIDAQFKAILCAIAESKAQSERITIRAVAPLHEPMAVLESQLQ